MPEGIVSRACLVPLRRIVAAHCASNDGSSQLVSKISRPVSPKYSKSCSKDAKTDVAPDSINIIGRLLAAVDVAVTVPPLPLPRNTLQWWVKWAHSRSERSPAYLDRASRRVIGRLVRNMTVLSGKIS